MGKILATAFLFVAGYFALSVYNSLDRHSVAVSQFLQTIEQNEADHGAKLMGHIYFAKHQCAIELPHLLDLALDRYPYEVTKLEYGSQVCPFVKLQVAKVEAIIREKGF
jgi:hypothetical protein